jgi:DNA polymerase III subunit delta'
MVTTPTESAVDDAFAGVVGQPAVVAQLRAAALAPVHAYLLVGAAGAGARAAADAFAAALLCPDAGCGHCRDCRLALSGEHPDAVSYTPKGAAMLRAEGEELIRLALRSPVEGRRKVLILADMHRVSVVAPMLLKTIEEPPESTVFVVLADSVPAELVTIASRCVRIDVPPLPPSLLEEVLVGEGHDPRLAAAAAAAAVGSLDRARLLAGDPGLVGRRERWAMVPRRLDGSGAAVVVLADELLAAVQEAAAPLLARQETEVAELDERVAAYGERGSGRKALEDRHKREQRRHRADELRFGLATLAGVYRDALTQDLGDTVAVLRGIEAIDDAAEALTRNPNETLLLQSLLLRLPSLPPLPGG